MVAAAIIGSAVVAGGASIYAGDQAASATRNASQQASADQTTALAQQAQLSAPYRAAGQNALGGLQNLLGLTPGSNPTTALQNTPGYQFTMQQGLDAILSNASATGGISGNTLTALDKFGTGLADQTYQNQVGNLFNLSGMGQAAAAGQAQNVGNAAGNLSNIAINQGNNIANLDMAGAANLSNITQNAISQGVEMNTLNSITKGLTSTSPASPTVLGT